MTGLDGYSSTRVLGKVSQAVIFIIIQINSIPVPATSSGRPDNKIGVAVFVEVGGCYSADAILITLIGIGLILGARGQIGVKVPLPLLMTLITSPYFPVFTGMPTSKSRSPSRSMSREAILLSHRNLLLWDPILRSRH